MGDIVNWRGAPDMHPATFIQEEMDARNWTRDRMAVAMAAADAKDPGICRLELDLYLDVGLTDDRLRLGKTGRSFAFAFGLSDEFFVRMESSWLAARPGSSPAADVGDVG